MSARLIIFNVHSCLERVKKLGGKKARPDFEKMLHQAVGDEDLESFDINAYIDTDAYYSLRNSLQKAGWNVKPFHHMIKDMIKYMTRFPNATFVPIGTLPIFIKRGGRGSRKQNKRYMYKMKHYDKRIITRKTKRIRIKLYE